MKNSETIDLNTIQYIYAKPYIEHYYLYGVNSTSKMSLIPKDALRELISDKLKCIDLKTENIVFSKNMPFLFDNSTKKIRQFQYVNDVPSKKEIEHKIFSEMEKSTLHYSSPLQNRYEDLFKNNSLLKNRLF